MAGLPGEADPPSPSLLCDRAPGWGPARATRASCHPAPCGESSSSSHTALFKSHSL